MKIPLKYTNGICSYPIFKSFSGLLEQTIIYGGLANSFINTFIFKITADLWVQRATSHIRYWHNSITSGSQKHFMGLLGHINSLMQIFAPFSKVLIIRGIGYRATIVYNHDRDFFLENSALDLNEIDDKEADDVDDFGREDFCNLYNHFFYRYVLIRVGHSLPTFIGIDKGIGIKTLKRDRKVVCYSFNKQMVTAFVNLIYRFRKPNAFTGRGIRYKKIKYKLKPGKRGSVKGRIW